MKLAESIGLTPVVSTFTVRFHKQENSNEVGLRLETQSRSHPLFDSLCAVQANVQGGSVIDGVMVIKLVAEEIEQYLVFPPEGYDNDIALSKLYYLTLGKCRIKQLREQFKQLYIDNIKKLEEELHVHASTIKLKTSTLNQLLRLRRRVIDLSERSRRLREQTELGKNFLEFHCGSFLKSTEKPLSKDAKGVIEIERVKLELFFLNPLDTLTKSVEADLYSLMNSVEAVSDIFATEVNLRLQISVKRLTVIATVVSIVSLIAAVVAFIK